MLKRLSLLLICAYIVMGISVYYGKKAIKNIGSVLSMTIEETPIPKVLGTISPTPQKTASPTPTPSPVEESFTPTPTGTPNNKFSPKPTPTKTPSPTPILPTRTPISTSTPSVTPAATASPSSSPTPTPTVSAFTGEQIYGFYNQYAAEYGVSADVLRHIARCESGFNPNARYLGYGGLYQFSESSWATYRNKMGLSTDPDLRFNPQEAIKTAAYVISIGKSSIWPNCLP